MCHQIRCKDGSGFGHLNPAIFTPSGRVLFNYRNEAWRRCDECYIANQWRHCLLFFNTKATEQKYFNEIDSDSPEVLKELNKITRDSNQEKPILLGGFT